jgi:hypothetical protein
MERQMLATAKVKQETLALLLQSLQTVYQALTSAGGLDVPLPIYIQSQLDHLAVLGYAQRIAAIQAMGYYLQVEEANARIIHSNDRLIDHLLVYLIVAQDILRQHPAYNLESMLEDLMTDLDYWGRARYVATAKQAARIDIQNRRQQLLHSWLTLVLHAPPDDWKRKYGIVSGTLTVPTEFPGHLWQIHL